MPAILATQKWRLGGLLFMANLGKDHIFTNKFGMVDHIWNPNYSEV
jgi:hypothetical protein